MAADGQGNDLAQVGVPIGGLIAFAPYDTVGGALSDADLGATPVTLPSGYEMLGLVKQDGAPQHAREAGDAIEFWQKGYTMPGDGTRTLQVSLAESNDAVLKLVEGKEANSAGVIYVDSGLPEARVLVFLATKFKGGAEERYNGVAQVTAVEVDQDERGAVRGRSVTLTWQEDPLFNGAPFKMWRGQADGVATPATITSALPASQGAGQVVTIVGTGFSGVTGVKFGAANAAMFVVESSTSIKAVLPQGSAGSAAVKVVKGAVESGAFAYTRDV